MASEAVPEAVLIRFKRDVRFPRFAMKAGETWFMRPRLSGQAGEPTMDTLAGRGDDRFAFAGGFCFVADIEVFAVGSRRDMLRLDEEQYDKFQAEAVRP